MTSINSAILTNNLTTPIQNSISTSAPDSSTKISKLTSKLYLGPGYTHVPGISNVLFAPVELYHGIKAAYSAYKIDDREGVLENVLRIIQVPINAGNSALQIGCYTLSAGIFFDWIDKTIISIIEPLSNLILGLGLVLCSIEFVLESFGLYQTENFLKNSYPFELENLKEILAIKDIKERNLKFCQLLKQISNQQLSPEIEKDIQSFLEKTDFSEEDYAHFSNTTLKAMEEKVYLSQLIKLQKKHFQISPEKAQKIRDYVENKLADKSLEEREERIQALTQANLQRKKNNLIRRVHPWLTNRIEDSATQIIRDLQSPNSEKKGEAVKKAASLFNHIKIQSQKKLLIHSVGLLALAVTIAGLIAGCIACPIAIPAILLMIGGGLAVMRNYMYYGYMDSEGWNFSIKRCIPKIVRTIYKKVFCETQIVNSPSFIPLSYTLPGSVKPLTQQNFERTLSQMSFQLAKP